MESGLHEVLETELRRERVKVLNTFPFMLEVSAGVPICEFIKIFLQLSDNCLLVKYGMDQRRSDYLGKFLWGKSEFKRSAATRYTSTSTLNKIGKAWMRACLPTSANLMKDLLSDMGSGFDLK